MSRALVRKQRARTAFRAKRGRGREIGKPRNRPFLRDPRARARRIVEHGIYVFKCMFLSAEEYATLKNRPPPPSPSSSSDNESGDSDSHSDSESDSDSGHDYIYSTDDPESMTNDQDSVSNIPNPTTPHRNDNSHPNLLGFFLRSRRTRNSHRQNVTNSQALVGNWLNDPTNNRPDQWRGNAFLGPILLVDIVRRVRNPNPVRPGLTAQQQMNLWAARHQEHAINDALPFRAAYGPPGGPVQHEASKRVCVVAVILENAPGGCYRKGKGKAVETMSSGEIIDGQTIDGQTIDRQTIDGQTIDGQAIAGPTITGPTTPKTTTPDQTSEQEITTPDEIKIISNPIIHTSNHRHLAPPKSILKPGMSEEMLKKELAPKKAVMDPEHPNAKARRQLGFTPLAENVIQLGGGGGGKKKESLLCRSLSLLTKKKKEL